MTISKTFFPFSLLLSACLLAACASGPQDAEVVDALPAIYPDYVDVTIPVGIAPLNFAMADDSVTAIDVEVSGAWGGTVHSKGSCTDFDIEQWHAMVKQNRGGQLNVSVCAKSDGNWKRYRDFHIHVAKTSIPDWGITYRRITPSQETFGPMGIYERELATFEEKTLLDNEGNEGMCINCHTPNHACPDQHVVLVRGSKEATLMHVNGKDELLKSANNSQGGTMVYPYWHPGGRYCAFSTNQTSLLFHTKKESKAEADGSAYDILVYDTEKHEIICDTLIMKKYWAENCPAFSPDGRWLYFTTARRQIHPSGHDQERYSLCRVGFDPVTGHIGQHVDTLVNTADKGKSVSWPRPSYDGRHVMYTLTDHGHFTIWHPEGDLWLLDLETSVCSPLSLANSDKADGFHNWSSDSQWFLFTSRRDNDRFSRIYLASISNDGKSTKPFLLPQRNPKRFYTQSLFSYNTPDFTERPTDNDSQAQLKALESGERTATKMAAEPQ